jgi:predicted TIM-barrel fold metal-dependent hydrolase
MRRRQWLEQIAAGGACLVAGQADAATLRGFIDAHVHVWTPDVDAYPLAKGFTKAAMKPASFTAEELLGICRPLGVSRVVLIQMSFYGFDNRYMLESIRRHPGTFAGVAVIDHRQPRLQGVVRGLAEQGVRGFRLYADRMRAESWAADEAMDVMWRCGADSNLAMCLLADPDAIPAIDRMCTVHPQTPVVIDHCARIGMRGEIDRTSLDLLVRLARFPRVHVKLSAFYALGRKQPPYDDLGGMVRELRDSFGAERLMWATDCPYQEGPGHGYAASLTLIRDRLDFLSAEDRTAILRDTASRLFFPG